MVEKKMNRQELRLMYYCWANPMKVFCLFSSREVCVKVVILAKINKCDLSSEVWVSLFIARPQQQQMKG